MVSPAGVLPDPGAEPREHPRAPRVVILEHDPLDPPMLLGQWLTEAGAELHVRRLHAGDEVPADLAGWDAVISMGGAMGAQDDDVAPWLPATRRLLAAAAAAGTPTLGVCLGAQLLAVATGGRVERGPDGPEIGAYLAAKRDAAETDPLFAEVPLSPDVMHFHDDVVSVLPPGAVLLLSSIGYPHQAFRVGSAAWGIQFHIETTAAVLRGWGRVGDRDAGDGAAGGDPDTSTAADVATRPGADPVDGAADPFAAERAAALAGPRCGPMLDEAEELMGQAWRAFAHRFVQLARDGVPPSPTGHLGPRLPLHQGDGSAGMGTHTDSEYEAGPA